MAPQTRKLYLEEETDPLLASYLLLLTNYPKTQWLETRNIYY